MPYAQFLYIDQHSNNIVSNGEPQSAASGAFRIKNEVKAEVSAQESTFNRVGIHDSADTQSVLRTTAESSQVDASLAKSSSRDLLQHQQTGANVSSQGDEEVVESSLKDASHHQNSAVLVHNTNEESTQSREWTSHQKKKRNIRSKLSAKKKLKVEEGIFHAIETNNLPLLKDSLSSGITPNTRETSHPLRHTAIHRACWNGCTSLVNYLLNEVNASQKLVDATGRTPLHGAAHRGHVDIVNLLLENEPNINAQSYSGDTPLHEAVRRNWVQVVKVLLEAGAEVDAVNHVGHTPIRVATQIGGGVGKDIVNLLRADWEDKDVVIDEVGGEHSKEVESSRDDSNSVDRSSMLSYDEKFDAAMETIRKWNGMIPKSEHVKPMLRSKHSLYCPKGASSKYLGVSLVKSYQNGEERWQAQLYGGRRLKKGYLGIYNTEHQAGTVHTWVYNHVFGADCAKKKRERCIDFVPKKYDSCESSVHLEETRENDRNKGEENSIDTDIDEEWTVGTNPSYDDDSFDHPKSLDRGKANVIGNVRTQKKACTKASEISLSNESTSSISVITHSPIATTPTSHIKVPDTGRTATERYQKLAQTCFEERRHEHHYQQVESKDLVDDLASTPSICPNRASNKAPSGTIAYRIAALAFQLNLNLNTSLTMRQQLECVEKAAEGGISEGPIIHRITLLERDFLG